MASVHSLTWRQIRTLTAANIKSRYRNTVAGIVWVVMSPLLMYSAQGYVFKHILKIGHANYPLFLLTGLMPWIFLTQSISMSAGLFIHSARLFKSFPIHPLSSLLSILIDNLINFVLTFLIILTGLTIFGDPGRWLHIFILPLPFAILFAAVVGLSWFLATLQVFFHDVRFITDFVMSVLFFLTPIFYPRDFVPEHLQWIIDLNPIAVLLRPIQDLSLNELPPMYFLMVLEAAFVALLFLALGAGFWRWRKNEIYFRL